MAKEDDDIILVSREMFAFGEINEEFGKRLTRDLLLLKSDKKAPLTIYLSSGGGDLGLSLGLYDLILAQPFDITIVGVGEVCSGASIILQAADRRILTNNSVLMLHSAALESESTGLKNLKSLHDITSIMSERMLDIYISKTGKSRQVLNTKLEKDWYLTADEALEENLIDEKF